MTGGDVWIGHDLGLATCTRSRYENENIAYFIPEEGGVTRHRTRWRSTPAPSTRSPPTCSSTTCSTREVSAANTNYIGYMGPNAAAKEFIERLILEDPAVNPDKAILEKLEELAGPPERRRRANTWTAGRHCAAVTLTAAGIDAAATSTRPASDEPRRRGRAAAPAPGAAAGGPAQRAARPARASPGSALFFVVPLAFIFVVSLGHAERAPPDRPRPADRSRTTSRRLRPDLPADHRPVALLRDRDDGPLARHRHSRSRTGSRATAGATRSCCSCW